MGSNFLYSPTGVFEGFGPAPTPTQPVSAGLTFGSALVASPVEPVSPVLHDGGCCSPDTIGIYSSQLLKAAAAAVRTDVAITLVKQVRMLWCVGLMSGYTGVWVSFDPGDFIHDATGKIIGVRNGFPFIPQLTLPTANEHVCFGYSDDITAYFVGAGVNCLPLILEKPVTKFYAHLLM